MRIGIIGAGNVGAALGRLLAGLGHEVAIANSRGPATLADLVDDVDGLRAATVREAATFGDVVVEAIPFGRYRELPADALAGRVVLSAANLYPERDGEVDVDGRVDTELVAEHLADSRVVKVFNTIWYRHLAEQGDASLPVGERRAIFLAGDDAEAKAIAARMVEELGFGAVDTGSLHEGGLRQQVGSTIYAKDLTVTEARAALAGDA